LNDIQNELGKIDVLFPARSRTAQRRSLQPAPPGTACRVSVPGCAVGLAGRRKRSRQECLQLRARDVGVRRLHRPLQREPNEGDRLGSSTLAMPLGSDVSFTGIIADVLRSVRPVAEQHRVPLGELETFDTLPERIQAEIAAANTVVGIVPIVSAWSRKSR